MGTLRFLRSVGRFFGVATDKLDEGSAINFDQLQDDLKQATAAAIAELRAAHPDEHFYAFALYTDDDATGVSAAANTEEGLATKLAAYNFATPAEGAFVRWSTAEWAYEGFGWDYFKPAYDQTSTIDHANWLALRSFRKRMIQVMIDVLAALDADGVFGRGDERAKVTLFCTITDSNRARKLERRSARALNPPAIAAAFEAAARG